MGSFIERCIFPLIKEAIQMLDEGVAVRASDVDVVRGAGYGFPRYRGGPLHYADSIGLQAVCAGNIEIPAKVRQHALAASPAIGAIGARRALNRGLGSQPKRVMSTNTAHC